MGADHREDWYDFPTFILYLFVLSFLKGFLRLTRGEQHGLPVWFIRPRVGDSSGWAASTHQLGNETRKDMRSEKFPHQSHVLFEGHAANQVAGILKVHHPDIWLRRCYFANHWLCTRQVTCCKSSAGLSLSALFQSFMLYLARSRSNSA